MGVGLNSDCVLEGVWMRCVERLENHSRMFVCLFVVAAVVGRYNIPRNS